MPRPKGIQKTGGRLKGTRNKVNSAAQDIADRIGVNPIEVLCWFTMGDWKKLGYEQSKQVKAITQYGELMEDVVRPIDRLSAAAELAQYLYPKKKAIEYSGPDGDAIPVEVVYVAEFGANDESKS